MSSTYGSLKTLMKMLQEGPSLIGVNVAFGEENIEAQEYAPPYVVVVPVGGGWGPPGAPGYFKASPVDLDNIWMTQENVDLYLWGESTAIDATAVDHADATEDLRARVLQALQYQAPNGLMFRPTNGSWKPYQDAVNRAGRAYVLTVQVDISIPSALPIDAIVLSETLTPQIVSGG